MYMSTVKPPNRTTPRVRIKVYWGTNRQAVSREYSAQLGEQVGCIQPPRLMVDPFSWRDFFLPFG